MKKRVIVLDAENRTITESEVSSIAEMQALVGGNIECVGIIPNRTKDEFYVNEEGLLKSGPKNFIVCRGAACPMAGNGFIIGGANAEGEFTSAKTDIAEVKRNIKFLSETDLLVAMSIINRVTREQEIQEKPKMGVVH